MLNITLISRVSFEKEEGDLTDIVSSEQEHDRMTSSSDVDDRTQHEIYAQPFLRSVMAGLTSVMCSYSAYFRTLESFRLFAID